MSREAQDRRRFERGLGIAEGALVFGARKLLLPIVALPFLIVVTGVGDDPPLPAATSTDAGSEPEDSIGDMMATVSQQKNLIPVSVLAPNGQGWNEGDQISAAKKLEDLIRQDLFPKYDIDLTRVLFSGQSSGGGFLSSHFIPTYGKGYQGGAFLQCGMAAPRVNFAPDEAMKKNFRLHFEITTGDTIWPQSYQQATAAYREAGIQFSKEDTLPGGHCAFDQQKVIQDRIDFILGTK